ncbi:MAG: endonuclease III [Desulfovibrio sp.]|nr:endonuclease III [Desulfovibrio sp.]
MRRQNLDALSSLAQRVLTCLQTLYPQPKTNLEADTPWQLLVATILSAQCTDKRVNQQTPILFARWQGPEDMAQASLPELECIIKPCGFYHNKAKNILATAKRIVSVYHGEVPHTLSELMTLPGVARKTANVVLFGAFGRNEGLAVDTHVKRISFRLGLTLSHDPLRIEQDLMRVFPQEEWGNVNHRMVWFGRDVCTARSPHCSTCPLTAFCPRNGVAE